MPDDRIHRCDLHVDDNGMCYLELPEDLDDEGFKALKTHFPGTLKVITGVEDPPIGPIHIPCKIIIFDCTGWGEGG